MSWAVVVDASDPRMEEAASWPKQVEVVEIADAAEAGAQVGALLRAGVEVAAVQGGDRFVAQLATVHRQQWAGHSTALRWLPLDLSEHGAASTVVAANLDAPAPERKLARRIERAIKRGKLTSRAISALRVTSSLAPTWELAFTVGAGELLGLFEEMARSRLGYAGRIGAALRSIDEDAVGPSGPRPPARISLDATPHPDTAWALLSALERSWFGLPMQPRGSSGEPRALLGDSLASLAPLLARARTPLARRDLGAARFDTAHFDMLDGYVLDGQLVEPTRPYVLQVADGHTVPMLSL
ncbi:MAG: hypothetical protein AAGI01_16680 [Myxococcota bacterium]